MIFCYCNLHNISFIHLFHLFCVFLSECAFWFQIPNQNIFHLANSFPSFFSSQHNFLKWNWSRISEKRNSILSALNSICFILVFHIICGFNFKIHFQYFDLCSMCLLEMCFAANKKKIQFLQCHNNVMVWKIRYIFTDLSAPVLFSYFS